MKNLIIAVVLALLGAFVGFTFTGCEAAKEGLAMDEARVQYNEVRDLGMEARSEFNAAISRHNRNRGSKAQHKELEQLKAELEAAMAKMAALSKKIEAGTASASEIRKTLAVVEVEFSDVLRIAQDIAK